MCVLLAQSAFSLFHPALNSNETKDIDIIVRTSSASIFGYFISANFIKRFSKKESTIKNKPDADAFTDIPLAISDTTDVPHKEEDSANRLQVIVATAIGLFCLIVLVMERNFVDVESLSAHSSSTATIAQFRDFVSGCVGFLIGMPTHRSS